MTRDQQVIVDGLFAPCMQGGHAACVALTHLPLDEHHHVIRHRGSLRVAFFVTPYASERSDDHGEATEKSSNFHTPHCISSGTSSARIRPRSPPAALIRTTPCGSAGRR